MPTENWKSRLDASQTEYLPLIINCLLGVQILATVRDPVVIGLDMPFWLAMLDAFLLVVMLSMAILVQTREVAIRFSHRIVMIGMLCTGAKAVASIAAQAEPLPFFGSSGFQVADLDAGGGLGWVRVASPDAGP